MDHESMGQMGMGDMSDGSGVPTPYHLQRLYWAFIGATIGTATIINIFEKLLSWQRLRLARKGASNPSKPLSIWMIPIATTTAICREICYATFTARPLRRLGIRIPTLGSVLLAASQLVLILVLCFYRMDPRPTWNWENLGYRTGYLATAQLPLIYILSGKNNIIGYLAGMGYEKINWIHRWTARVLFLTVTIHMIFWFRDWARYDYILTKLQTDKITQRGFSAWVILLWMFLSSFRPLRALSYEFFVIQHLVTMAGFSAAVYLHLPTDMKYVLWISVAFAIFDRVARALNVVVRNTNWKKQGWNDRAIGHRAQLEKLPGDVTKITIDHPNFTWSPGQHVFMSCHSVAPLQSHPFTISTLPSDGKLSFIVKAHHGGTRRFHQKADEVLPLLTDARNLEARFATVEGPYGRIRPLQQFDSVVFLAGSTGSTFTVPLMRDLVNRCSSGMTSRGDQSNRPYQNQVKPCVTKHIRFFWVVKSRTHLCWFAEEINNALRLVEETSRHDSLQMSVGIYVTCDDQFEGNIGIMPKLTDGKVIGSSEKASGMAPANDASTTVRRTVSSSPETCGPNGTCCCTMVVEEGNEEGITECHCNCDGEASEDVKIVREPTTTGSLSELSTTSIEKSAAIITSTSAALSEAPSAPSPTSINSPPTTISTNPTTTLHPSISLTSGRPNVRSLIRRTLEQARGETAVVACGPEGLITDVRTSVVSLSDERAVHKGTGALGVYLHTESFCF